jgi:hypothetical protein
VDKYIQMAAYETADAEAFVMDLFGSLVDPARRDTLAATEGWSATVPGYRSELYPFTEGAFHKFCRYFGQQPKYAKPSEIIAKIDFLAAEAFLANKRMLDEDFLVEQGINA